MIFNIGPYRYLSKKAAAEAVQAILHGATLYVPLTGDKLSVVQALFEMHPESDVKSEKGEVGQAVKINIRDQTSARGFHVLHHDGSSTRWSYRVALDGKLRLPTATGAMRAAISDSQKQRMNQVFWTEEVVRCPVCGTHMRACDADVDHVAPRTFKAVAAAFIAQHGAPEVKAADDLGSEFVDLNVKAHWIIFHDLESIRQVLCQRCHRRGRWIKASAC